MKKSVEGLMLYEDMTMLVMVEVVVMKDHA